jgi:hypothetical protein
MAIEGFQDIGYINFARKQKSKTVFLDGFIKICM